MDTKTFLESVLGDEGSYCVWANRIADKHKVQKFYPTIDALIHAAHNLDDDGYDAYFALGTFDEAGSREAANVKQLRAFFLDLDCGPTKEYASQSEALRSLQNFCKQTQLPRPTLINSGRGIHVYWRLTTPVSRETWQPIADKLKTLCRKHKLFADPVVTADAARVLRVPGTHNHKDEPPTDVKLVGEVGNAIECSAFSDILGDVVDEDSIFKGARKYVPREADALMQALSGSFVSRFKTIMMKTVKGTGCAQLGEAVSKQADVSEPLWRAALSVAKFCVDGGKAVHKISEKHPDYSHAATEAKVELIKGPYLCERFNEYNANVCPSCTHWGKIKSPISLGREVEEASEEDNIVVQTPLGVPEATPITYIIPKFPTPFFRGKSGGVFKRGKQVFKEDGEIDDEASKDKLVYFNDLYVVRRLKDPEMGESLVMRLHLPKDGVREFTIPLTAVGSKDEFRKHLAMHGVAVLNVTDLMEYTMQWVNELQLRTEAEEARRQFGWSDDHASFAVGGSLVFKDRVEINAPSGATVGLFPYFVPKGTLEGWKQTMRFYAREGMEPHQFMVGLSFGSVLMEFQPINAAAFHIYSKDSGLGKTTGMLAGASVWGDPDLLMMQERDTFNSKMNRAEVYKNLPCYMDELTNTKPQDLSDWAYQLPSGLQRNRMGPKGNVERARGKPWKTLFGTTGNTDMLERIALFKALPKAEAQRVLQYRVERVQFATKAETDNFATAVKENYGHAGIVFLQYVMNNLEAVKQLAVTVQQKIDVASGLTAENRFWSVLVSRTITGLMIAKKAGLLEWKIEPLVKWSIGVMQTAHNNVREMNTDVEAILTDYLAEHYSGILRIKSTDDARKPPTIDMIIQPAEAMRSSHLVARYEYDIKKLYLLTKPLKEWCGKQQINYGGFIDGLKQNRTKAHRVKMRLSKGTHMNLPPTDVLALDCTEFMDDEVEQAMATAAALHQKPDSE